MKKRILSLLLCLSMIFSMNVTAFATEPSDAIATTSTISEEESSTVKVGDIVWIKSGSITYKDYKNPNAFLGSRSVWFDYKTKVVSIVTDDAGNIWYEFEPTGLLQAFSEFKYVQANSTTTEMSDEEVEKDSLGIPVCDCDYSEEGGLDKHADRCARKDYLRNTYITENTAETIFENWEEMDAETRSAILLFLSWDDSAKLEELNNLLFAEEDSPNVFTGETSSGTYIGVYTTSGTFSEEADMVVSDTTVDEDAVEELLAKETGDIEILGIKAVDIEFGEQPTSDVTLQILVPANEVPADANQVYVIHFGANGPEIISNNELHTNATVHNIIVTAESFSSYAAVFVNSKYSSTLLSEELKNSIYEERYSIETFNVDLFDYDPSAFNATLDEGNTFHFVGYQTGETSNDGVNDSNSGYAKQGIVENSLVNGLPVFNYVTNGTTNAEAFFSDTDTRDGKTVHNDVDFEFIYDNKTGYYEYKSSANHAQYDSSSETIKLYADTLSTENNSRASTIDLTKGAGTNDFAVTSSTATSLKATLKDDGTAGGRFDPYISFTKVLTADGKEAALALATTNEKNEPTVSQIYIKAKIPAEVGSNQLQLFFQNENGGYHEDRSFVVDYTANGDWIEFVIDTTKDQKNEGTWNGTITGLRLDLFDGNRGSFDTTKSYDVEVAEIRFITTNETHQTWGGFYPFTDLENTYVGNSTEPFSMDSWANHLQDSSDATMLATRSMGNAALSATDLTKEIAFGTVMEFDFYIPVDQKSTIGEDLIYYFNGDDDLWVFVDDTLVLDIGGGHGAISGTVNFTTGKSVVESAVTVDGFSSNEGSAGKKEVDLSSALTSPGKHTMKVFYLERCGSVSNCHMKFNLPQTPEGDVTISKTLELENYDANADDSSVKTAEAFEFTISASYALSGTPSEALNLSYTIQKANGDMSIPIEIANGGTLSLKHGETAYFEIPEGYKITVTETARDISGYDWVSTTINGTSSPTKSATMITQADTSSDFKFVNSYKEQIVTYTYIPVNPEGCPDEVKGTVTLTDNSATTYEVSGISEKVGARLGNPVGAKAAGSSAVIFIDWYEDAACEEKVSSTHATVNNTDIAPVKTNGLYTGGTFYAKFEYMYGDLTISKSGIQTVDHHVGTSMNNEEQQSTVYRIYGTSHSGIPLDMEVVIVGNGSTTIKHIPVGNYTVTEIDNWSWRYDVQDNETKNVTIVEGGLATAAYTNLRTEPYWLSGDNYCENWWQSENTIVKRTSDNQIID